MSFNSVTTEKLQKILSIIKKRDPVLFSSVEKKMLQIALCDTAAINHFKNLRGSMSHLKRVHIGSFILTFHLEEDTVIFESLEHHDRAYG